MGALLISHLLDPESSMSPNPEKGFQSKPLSNMLSSVYVYECIGLLNYFIRTYCRTSQRCDQTPGTSASGWAWFLFWWRW